MKCTYFYGFVQDTFLDAMVLKVAIKLKDNSVDLENPNLFHLELLEALTLTGSWGNEVGIVSSDNNIIGIMNGSKRDI